MRVGDVIGDRFLLEREIGSGGMGIVFRAADRLTGVPAAVKVLHGRGAQESARFEREAEVLARFVHDGVVGYRGYGSCADGRPFLAMEWLDGEDLQKRLSLRGVTIDETIRLGIRVASALDAIHRAGIIHRDVKPANLFLVGGDVARVKLLDFGIAHLAPDPMARQARITLDGMMIGTPGYLAPEQIRAEDVDARTDVFALGAVLFECLSRRGSRAFTGDEMMAVLAKVLFEPTPRTADLRSGLPLRLGPIVDAMLEKDPHRRPSSAAEVAGALDTVVDTPPEVPAPSLAPGAGLSESEQRVVSVVAVAAHNVDRSGVGVTLPAAMVDRLRAVLLPVAARHATRIEVMPDGSAVSVVGQAGAAGTPAENAVRAARLALAVAPLCGRPPIVVSTGRTLVGPALPVGEAINRAVATLGETAPGEIRIDGDTAGLLDARFEVVPGATTHLLVAERDVAVTPRIGLAGGGRFVGRERELDALVESFHECVGGRAARAAVVIGEAGLGKTRLARELLTRLPPPLTTLLARGDSMHAGSPLAMLAPGMRALLGIRDGATLDECRATIERRLAACLAPHPAWRTAPFIGEIAGIPYPDEGRPDLRAARSDPVVMGDRLRSAFLEWLAGETRVAPVLVLLEDVQWGDRATVGLADEALKALASHRLFVVALARPEIHATFPRLFADRARSVFTLAPLPATECEALVAGRGLAPRDVERVVARAAGNPFFLQELVRAIEEGRGDAALPATVLGTVEAHLSSLASKARLVLRAASVLGERFWPGAVGALLGDERGGVDVSAWLRALAQIDLVTPLPGSRFAGEEEHAFRHALLREAAYATLTDRDRQRGHRLAGRWLERVGEPDAAVLALHSERGGEPERAAVFYERATADALAKNDLPDALDLAHRGLAAGATGTVRGLLFTHRAEALLWAGELGEARSAAEAALAALPPGEPARYAAIAVLTDAVSILGTPGNVDVRVVELLGAVPPPEAQRGWADCVARVVVPLALLVKLELAERAMALAERAAAAGPADPLLRGRLHHARAVFAVQAGSVGAALDQMAQGVAAYEEAGAFRWANGERSNLAGRLLDLGAADDALDVARASLAQAEQLGIAYGIAFARLMEGMAEALRGDRDRARAVLEQAASELAGVGDVRLESAARSSLAEQQAAAGESEAALEEARRAIALVAGLGPPRAAAMAVLARLLLRDGRAAEALEVAGGAMQVLASEPMDDREIQLRLAYAESLAATGAEEGARMALADAARIVRYRADRIDAGPLRESFLTRVPENARVLALVALWGL